MNATAMPSNVFLSPLPARHVELFAELGRWVAHGWLRALDRSFAAFLAQGAPDADPLLILGAALASHQLGRGHACLDLQTTLANADHVLSLPPDGAPRTTEEVPPSLPSVLLAGVDLRAWNAALAHDRLVGDGPGATPLVRVGSRLYLRRYWQYEQSVRQAIAQRLTLPTPAALPGSEDALRGALDALFPRRDGAPTDWQKIACALAARQRFSIITGGPGTGKTTTVVRLLAVLQHLSLSAAEGGRRLRIRLAAPTGKAAARLNESIAGAVARLPLSTLPGAEAIRAAIPTEVSTVHRLLGSLPETRRFRHDARNPLALDVLVLDEASMLDLEMMALVLAALPPQASLILLGDKDQLASVEAGAVLGDLCQRADGGHYREDTANWVERTTGESIDEALRNAHGEPLDQAVVKLRVSHRFSADSGIGMLAEAVNAGDDAAVRRVFDQGFADLARQAGSDDEALRRLVIEGAPENFLNHGQGRQVQATALQPPRGYRHYLCVMRERQPRADAPQSDLDDWARDVLAAYGQFQLLCALRNGPQGVEGLNRRIADLLRAEGLLEADKGGWYPGRPVLVTRNDYGLGLMNGDVGVTLALPVQVAEEPRLRWMLRVAFATGDGQGRIRWVLPSRLRAVETVFAMTVHKSQGSEFTHAVLLLPERPSPVLTRELVYTGVTRAKHWFTLAATPPVLQAAIRRRVERVGGLARRPEAGG